MEFPDASHGQETERVFATCDGCGVCCLDQSLPPFDANEELVRAPGALLQELEDYARGPRFRDTNPCPWLHLESGRCRHHELRPAACRWFVPGSSACNELRRRAGLPEAPVASPEVRRFR